MVNSVSAQTLEFLYSALLGAGFGVLFDIMRVLRAYIPKSRATTAVFDTLYWILAIIALLAFIMTVSNGKMRWYVLFGVFSGGFVYAAALSEIVFKVMRASVLIAKKVLSLMTRPIYLLLRGMWRVGKKTEKKLEHNLKNACKKREKNKRKKCDKEKSKKEGKSKWPRKEKSGKEEYSQS